MRTRSFAESGGSAALNRQSASDTQTSSTLGLRAHTGLLLGQTQGQLRATLGWQHAFGDKVAYRTLAFDGSQASTVASVSLARDAAVVELGAYLEIARSTTLGLSYSGQFGSGNREHKGVLSLQWRY